MAYSNDFHDTITFPAVNFGSDSTTSFRGPKGMRFRVNDIRVICSTLFTAVTTAARVQLGIGGALTTWADMPLGTLAAGDTLMASQLPSTPVVIVDHEVDADTKVVVTFKAPTGGSPAGVGTVEILGVWY